MDPTLTADDVALRATLAPRADDAGVQAVTVVVEGELDLHSASVLRSVLNEAEEAGPDRVVLDLGGLTFIDSAGIGVLVGALRRLEARGGTLTVVDVPNAIRRVFDVTHLSKAFGLAGRS